MRRLIKKYRPLLGLLLLLQATTVYALPADIHLNLCLGSDGHLEISTDFCTDTQLFEQSQPLSSTLSNDDHHGDCLDIIVNCDLEEELFSTSEEALLSITKVIGNCLPLPAVEHIYFSPNQLYNSATLFSGLISRASPPAHIEFINMTVLLI